MSSCHSDWEGAILDEITVKDVSGFGGNRTYKITRVCKSNKDIAGEVAFHVVGKNNNSMNQPGILEAQTSATIAFANAGLCPKRLAQKRDEFFIDQWLPNSKNLDRSVLDVALATKMGCLLGKIHQIDPKWYLSHYERLLKTYPGLASVPKGSSIWYLIGRNWPLLFKVDHAASMGTWMRKILKKQILDLEIKPITTAGKRIVTTHGDFDQGNVIESQEGILNAIDFEQTHVSFAIQDISYFFNSLPCVSNIELKLAFCSAYLAEIGYPHEASDVFDLALDAERCALSSGFMSPIIEAFIEKESLSLNDVEELQRLKCFADATLRDKELAHEVLKRGMSHCMPFLCTGNGYDVGSLVSVGDLSLDESEEAEKSRYQFLINGDGTIMPKNAPSWKGLVLGANLNGEVVLTNHCDTERRLELSSTIMKSVFVTGYSIPKSKPFPLLIKSGTHSGRAITRSRLTGTWYGNRWFRMTVGDSNNAVSIHFENDGAMRFADHPDQAFNCEHKKYTAGTNVTSYQYHDSDHQKFVRNTDNTISPIKNCDMILALEGDCLQLQPRKSVHGQDLLIFDLPECIPIQSLLPKGPIDICEKDDPVENTISSILLLNNPKNKGINIQSLILDEESEKYLGSQKSSRNLSHKKLVIVNYEDAAEAMIDSDKNYITMVFQNNEHRTAQSFKSEINLMRVGCWN